MIDSHCHLSQVDYDLPVADLIEIAHKEGVEKMLNIACDTGDWDELLQVIKTHKNVYGAIGIHPEYALRDEKKFLDRLPEIFAENPKLLAIGEIGLDYSDETISPEKQQALFNAQIQIAHEIKKPIIVHTRDAEEDTLLLLKKAYQEGKLKNSGIIHCFSGSLKLAQEVLKMGFYISVSGIVTFKSAHTLREIIKEIPLDRLLVETDCPWLAPEPFRGRKNQPAYVIKTLEKVAELKGISAAELNKITTQNFHMLFRKEK
ncbi:MAG: TatD family hydrolase [Alphaproteobacteria bacterium]